MELMVDGYKIFIDADDIPIFYSRHWRIKQGNVGGPYLCYFTHNRRIQFHREIMKAVGECQIDHINGNTLDNRKDNLRICSHSENQWNRNKYKTNKSGYKGVSFNNRAGKWVAQIQKYGQKYFIGYYNTPESAYNAYIRKAKELHGEFARF